MNEDCSGFQFRTATNDDCGEVERLVYSVLEEYGLEAAPETTDADLKDIQSHYLRRGGVFEVLVSPDERIVGCWGLYRIDETTCELRKMYLKPECRGKGLGKETLLRALSTAKEMGYKRMTLETATPLKEAIRLYKAFGFRPYQAEHKSSRTDQTLELRLG